MKLLLTPIIVAWQVACSLVIFLGYSIGILGWIVWPMVGVTTAAERGDHWLSGLVLGVVGAALAYRLLNLLSGALFALAGGGFEKPFGIVGGVLTNNPELQRAGRKAREDLAPHNPLNPAHPMYDD
jgi:hypothetical protein